MGSISNKTQRKETSAISWFDDDEILFSSINQAKIEASNLYSVPSTTISKFSSKNMLGFEQPLPKAVQLDTQSYKKPYNIEKIKLVEPDFLAQPPQLNLVNRPTSSNSSSNDSVFSWTSAISKEQISNAYSNHKNKSDQNQDYLLHQSQQKQIKAKKINVSDFIAEQDRNYLQKLNDGYSADYSFEEYSKKKNPIKLNEAKNYKKNNTNIKTGLIDTILRPETKGKSSVNKICFTHSRKNDNKSAPPEKNLPFRKTYKTGIFSDTSSRAQKHEDLSYNLEASEKQNRGNGLMRSFSMRSLSWNSSKRPPQNFRKEELSSEIFKHETKEPYHNLGEYFQYRKSKNSSKKGNGNIAKTQDMTNMAQSVNPLFKHKTNVKANAQIKENKRLGRSKTTKEKYSKIQEKNLGGKMQSLDEKQRYFQSEINARRSLEQRYDHAKKMHEFVFTEPDHADLPDSNHQQKDYSDETSTKYIQEIPEKRKKKKIFPQY